mmetsp:Transcript_67840/g.189997  ORF Transcript_67840/g.189997 Transcript_67840/m.189997 type:complete len:257 (-) Transcript_67840:2-772(-)
MERFHAQGVRAGAQHEHPGARERLHHSLGGRLRQQRGATLPPACYATGRARLLRGDQPPCVSSPAAAGGGRARACLERYFAGPRQDPSGRICAPRCQAREYTVDVGQGQAPVQRGARGLGLHLRAGGPRLRCIRGEPDVLSAGVLVQWRREHGELPAGCLRRRPVLPRRPRWIPLGAAAGRCRLRGRIPQPVGGGDAACGPRACGNDEEIHGRVGRLVRPAADREGLDPDDRAGCKLPLFRGAVPLRGGCRRAPPQ